MKNLAKLIVISVFGLSALVTFLNSFDSSGTGSSVLAQVAVKPTPPANVNATTNTAANTPANTSGATNVNAVKPAVPAAAGDKTMAKSFVLCDDSLSEYGESPFNHENHAFKNYSPDGKSVVGCVECHHTDQPKSALKPPLLTSERDVTLTFDSWKASTQKVNECRTCHFQDGNVPEDKTMPSVTYTEGGKATPKDLNNELAYHINCNTCHDNAFKLRPELKSKPGFATGKDCTTCHKKN
jgi:cytochrome c553